MRLKKHTNVLLMMAITSLLGCAPTEEEKKLAEEEEKNKPSLSIQPVGTLLEPDDSSFLTSATVIMSKTVDDNVTLQYSLNSKTATAGSDFEAKSGTLTIPSGSNSASIDLIILADEFDEQDEKFTIVLSSPVNAKLGIASEVVVIKDSLLDVTPVVSIEPVLPLTEPDLGSESFTAIVKLSSTTSFPIRLNYSLDGLTASDGVDFEAKTGTIEITPGEDSAEIELVIIADDIDEPNEDFSITLAIPEDTQATPGIITQIVSIQDSELDVKPVVSIGIVDTLIEPDNGSETFSATVNLSSLTSFPVTVDYKLENGTAVAGGDFDGNAGTLIIAPGDGSAVIDLIINADDIDEFDEEFSITLSSPVNATIDVSTETFVIQDSESDVTEVSFTTGSAVVAEGLSGYKVKLALSHASSKGVSILFSTSGVAVKDLDYNIVSDNLIPVYGNYAEIVIDFVDDGIDEGGESLILQLEPTENAILGEQATFTFTIPGELGLNDTGIKSWYDGSSFSGSGPDAAYPGQDADFGYDSEDSNDADGAGGFSFTELDIHGNPLTKHHVNARCVQDNRTGLVYELKHAEELLPTQTGADLSKHLDEEIIKEPYIYENTHKNWQANNFRYFWISKDASNNGGNAGNPGEEFVNKSYPISENCAFDENSESKYCNSEVYTNAINELGLCGFKDWKLPTIEQLRSIHNYQGVTISSGNSDYFPNTKDGNYISATPSVDRIVSAWCISGNTGQVSLCKKDSLNYIRMVRGGAK